MTKESNLFTPKPNQFIVDGKLISEQDAAYAECVQKYCSPINKESEKKEEVTNERKASQTILE